MQHWVLGRGKRIQSEPWGKNHKSIHLESCLLASVAGALEEEGWRVLQETVSGN